MSLCEHFKVNPWDHKKMWNCLLNTQQVMKHIGFLPPAESMFVVQPFSLNNIWFLQFGCLTKSSETNRLLGGCGGYFTALIYSVKWKNETVGKHPRVMVSVHFDWKKNKKTMYIIYKLSCWWLSTSIKSSESLSSKVNCYLLFISITPSVIVRRVQRTVGHLQDRGNKSLFKVWLLKFVLKKQNNTPFFFFYRYNLYFPIVSPRH